MYVEGKPDEVLVQGLCISRRLIGNGNHKSGVLKHITQTKGLLGIVDEDPDAAQSRSKLMNEFRFIEKRYQIALYEHQSNGNQLIVLCPELEAWILRAVKASKVNISQFNLPNNPSALHRVVNTRLPNLEKLINELIIQQNPAILCLKNLLTP